MGGGTWMLITLLGMSGALALWRVFGELKRARLIEDTPTSRIRSAAQGYAELTGTARAMPGAALIAPLSGLECLWYRYTVEHREREAGSNWRQVAHGISESLFELIDDASVCVIDPEGAQMIIETADRWHGDAPWPATGPQKAVTGLLRGLGQYRYTEQRLAPGTPLYAIGQFRSLHANATATLKEDTLEILRNWKRDTQGLLQRFDANGDGAVDMDEWALARQHAEREALTWRAERALDPADHLLSRPDDRRLPFIISTRPQRLLARRYRLQALAWLVIPAGLVGAWFWL